MARNAAKNAVYNSATTYKDISHQVISSYFIGPQAENLPYFKENIHIILEELEKARKSYFPEDGTFIDEQIQNTPAFLASMDKMTRTVRKAANILGRSSIPFWSPRYEAHMCTDMSMASLLGYFMTMLYNPNNVAIEASPLTTVAEIEVGEQLCELFGYNIDPNNTEAPTAWGHVTCGGLVCPRVSKHSLGEGLAYQYEARNLKFYPLSLRQAFERGQAFDFLSDSFHVENCQGTRKLFTELSTWELLNLKPSDILELPDRLYQEHGISNAFTSEILTKFTIQSTGKDVLERTYQVKPCQYMLANTRHYSWPKGAAIAGLGSDSVIGIPVDLGARVDMRELEKALRKSLEEEQPVLAVVAIIGSTEEGAVDPLSEILALRKQLQAEGLSFLVHADAAWGGYFCSMLPREYRPGDVTNISTDMGDGDGFVPDASLRTKTQEDLYAMRYVDSITVDPHKSGYIPYPAGGLCYRDGRMRFLLTWTAPVLSRGSVTSIGIYGVEGSKPGAAAMSIWLANKMIGLNPEGYGSLLGEVTWTCTRLSAEWAALTDSSSPFICVPFNMLPSELGSNPTEEKIEAEKQRIRRDIVNKTNAEIANEDRTRPDEVKAMKLMRELGSDLNINAFALNFRYEDGRLNDDIEEANYLMQRVVETLSVDSPTDDPTKIPLYLTSTEFSDELYGKCKMHFMKRLGIEQSTQNLMVLRNVVMSPFPTDGNFTNDIAQKFFDIVAAEAEVVRKRNTLAPDFHNFLIQGTEVIYLIHLPMFHVANHRQQLIVSAKFDKASKQKYVAMKRSYPAEPMILVTQNKTFLKDVVDNCGRFKAQVMTKESGIILRNVDVVVQKTIVSRPLNSKYRLKDYPLTFMPFYLYGNENEAYIDHVITRAPNTQLSAGRCKLEWYKEQSLDIWERPLVLLLENVREAPMQPLPPNGEIGCKYGAVVAHSVSHRVDTLVKLPSRSNGHVKTLLGHNQNGTGGLASLVDNFVDEVIRVHREDESASPHKAAKLVNSETRSGTIKGANFFFRPGATFKVGVWEDGDRSNESSRYASFELGKFIGRGTLTLGDSVYVDSEAMNFDPFKKVEKVSEWRYEFNQIGKELD
ncbi:pyridoxal-dependent decarboxylase domain-containing protein [Xylaria bambusicola]|uniref:pyridoxal-dependent decarboxylase domain-containing protein n=1 Tax=Xylaria bambusicola TaxID=326684 RepID=UPI002008977A|nr:pyridoxal-dependent decarboxylase domain-containing protein [Xylaria bambusicola]KAI0517404.1 pyridoxal-dependent decarboxylase domain-containing protein [Xylaria bambusicola]